MPETINCFIADGNVSLDMTNVAYLTDLSGLEQIYVNKYRGDKPTTTTINNNYIIIDYDINQHITYMPNSTDLTDDAWGLDSVNLSFGDDVLYTHAVLDLPLTENKNTYLSRIPMLRGDPSLNLSDSYSSYHIEVLGDVTTTELGMFDVSHIHYFIRNAGDLTNIHTPKNYYNTSHSEQMVENLRNFQILGYKKENGSDSENTIKLYLAEKNISLDDVNTYVNQPDRLQFVLDLTRTQATLDTNFLGIDTLESWYQQEVDALKYTVQTNNTLNSVGLTLYEIPYDASSNLSSYAREKLTMDNSLNLNTWNRPGQDLSNNIDMRKVFDEGEFLVCDTSIAYVPTLTEHSHAGITEFALQNIGDSNMVHIILRQNSSPPVI